MNAMVALALTLSLAAFLVLSRTPLAVRDGRYPNWAAIVAPWYLLGFGLLLPAVLVYNGWWLQARPDSPAVATLAVSLALPLLVCALVMTMVMKRRARQVVLDLPDGQRISGWIEPSGPKRWELHIAHVPRAHAAVFFATAGEAFVLRALVAVPPGEHFEFSSPTFADYRKLGRRKLVLDTPHPNHERARAVLSASTLVQGTPVMRREPLGVFASLGYRSYFRFRHSTQSGWRVPSFGWVVCRSAHA